MRSRGTRVDNMTVEPIGEDRPGFYRMIRFGNFTESEGSEEMIVNKKELDSFIKQAVKILYPNSKITTNLLDEEWVIKDGEKKKTKGGS